ncbi:MAG: hypothetical protein HC890_01570 [Chloroflexaceae bacterium]|nr:hypothetical protein [Chloroflexaceae bacterium]
MAQQTQQNSDTGISNENYNLVSVLYHALESAATYELYAEDARETDDEELAKFFEEVKSQNSKVAERAQRLLAKRLS